MYKKQVNAILNEIIQYLTFGILIFLLLFLFTIIFRWRAIMKRMVRKVGNILLTDDYQENLLELIPGFRHMGIQNVLENNFRAETGEVLHRPLGSSKNWPHLDAITFLPAQTDPFPVSEETKIDIAVTIGPQAKKPLELEKPFLISAMPYGVALHDKVRMSLVHAANETGIAINSGEGPVLPEELNTANKFVLQFSRTKWAKDEKLIKQADMIEVKLGQGSTMGLGSRMSPEDLTGKARNMMDLEEDEIAIIHEHFFDNQTLEDLKGLVTELRELSGGVPIGVKIGAGGKIEQDIDHVLQMGVDYIAVDGGQAATLGSPPIIADDFGIPTFHAVIRASNHLNKLKMKDKVSLIISGGLMNPGDYLKVLALGADAVYLGSVMLFTVSHKQVFDALPFEPPTQVVWNEGKKSESFDTATGTDAATKLINASTEEIMQGIRAMGKASLDEVTRNDLVSYDEATAKAIGVPYTLEAWKEAEKTSSQQKNKEEVSNEDKKNDESKQTNSAKTGSNQKEGNEKDEKKDGNQQSDEQGNNPESANATNVPDTVKAWEEARATGAEQKEGNKGSKEKGKNDESKRSNTDKQENSQQNNENQQNDERAINSEDPPQKNKNSIQNDKGSPGEENAGKNENQGNSKRNKSKENKKDEQKSKEENVKNKKAKPVIRRRSARK
jgi:glutamate synthase domain-containing protein 2